MVGGQGKSMDAMAFSPRRTYRKWTERSLCRPSTLCFKMQSPQFSFGDHCRQLLRNSSVPVGFLTEKILTWFLYNVCLAQLHRGKNSASWLIAFFPGSNINFLVIKKGFKKKKIEAVILDSLLFRDISVSNNCLCASEEVRKVNLDVTSNSICKALTHSRKQ